MKLQTAAARVAAVAMAGTTLLTADIVTAAQSVSTPNVRSSSRARAFTAADTARVDRLLKLVQQGLDRAPEIAESRWTTMTRIEDSASELKAIDATRSESTRQRLDPELAARFAMAQIEAGKAIQAARHRQWALEGKTTPTRAAERNASVIAYQAPAPEPAMGAAMLRALRDAAVVLRRAGGRQLLDARAADLIQLGGADLLAGQIALKPLYEIAH